jgi:poly-gamma-glutamate capsule biosynthesis protein CapA/YwtB (metallophosphatase superfamily)
MRQMRFSRGDSLRGRCLLTAACCLLLLGCNADATPPPAEPPAPAPEAFGKPAKAAEAAPAKTTVVIAAVGDVLPHSPVRASAERNDEKGPDGKSLNHRGYDTLFARALPAFKDADIAFANLETPIAPKNDHGTRPFVFNAPTDLLDALKAANVRVVSYANNHAYDQGRPAFAETLDNLDARGLLAAGSGRSAEEAYTPRVIEEAGMKLCFMGLTRLLNINLQPQSEADPQTAFIPYGAAGPAAIEKALAKVGEAKKGCDFLLVSIHWGSEYVTLPADEDVTFAKKLLDAGADGILGHHPHVLQPLKTYDTKDGRKAFVAYSMGNFVSNQTKSYPRGKRIGHTRDSMVLRVTVERSEAATGPKGVLKAVGYYPAWTDRQTTPAEGAEAKTLIRGVLLDREIAEAKAALAALEGKALTADEEKAKKAWAARQKEFEARRATILKIVGEELALPLPEEKLAAEGL